MNGLHSTSTDLDPVSGQLVTGSYSPIRMLFSPVRATRMIFWAAVALALGLGIHEGGNPTDQMARCAAVLPLTLLLVDGWALGVALRQKPMRAFFSVVAAGIHLALWFWAAYLTRFDVFYRLDATGPFGGVYGVRWTIALLLGLVVLASLAPGAYEVLASMKAPGAERPVARDLPGAAPEADTVLLGDHVYEAQVLLNNLGYDVGGIDGELNATTQAALAQFQASVGLAQKGAVTALTIAALRTRWRAQEPTAKGLSLGVFASHIGRRICALARARLRR